jgi:hypothetical protein
MTYCREMREKELNSEDFRLKQPITPKSKYNGPENVLHLRVLNLR